MGGQFYGVMLDHEWEATFTNYSPCFGEVNGRQFRFLNAQAAEHSSVVIRRHLRNAFVKRMSCSVMTRDFDWTVVMLIGLGASTVIEELNVLVSLRAVFIVANNPPIDLRPYVGYHKDAIINPPLPS